MNIASFSPARTSLRVDQDGFNILLNEVQTNPTPLASIRTIAVSINGQPVSPEDISLYLRNHRYQASNLEAVNGETWHPQEPLTLQIQIPDLVRLGYHYEIEVEIGFKDFNPTNLPEKRIFKNILVAC